MERAYDTRTADERDLRDRFGPELDERDELRSRIPPDHHAYTDDQRSIGQLVRDLSREVTLLFRQEVELAKTEMQEKAAKVARNSGYAGAGGAVAYAGLLAVIAAACIGAAIGLAAMGLDASIAYWLGPLIVGLIVAGIGYAMLQKGITTIKHEGVVPHKTVDSLQETRQWMNAKIR